MIRNRRALFASLGAGLLTLGLGSLSLVSAEDSAAKVELVPVKYTALLSKLAETKGARLIMMDAWATWCGPCKENFPHVVEMHEKYGPKGLSVVSLSMDDTEKPKKVAEALDFLKSKKATFRNFVLDETLDEGFESLKVTTIPAVFLYGPDGKEIKRFTMDDPNNQYTYKDVEEFVAKYLAGK